uniref:Uncharacterized protein n=1 Tax=Seriola lalandi dorsalis TaxID=1841481 RepID=A0A3B4XKT4_SERLL
MHLSDQVFNLSSVGESVATAASGFWSGHTTPEKFFIEACDEGADAVLAIDRVSNEMTLAGKKDVPPSAVTRPICGIMGTIRLVAGRFLCHTTWCCL